MSKSTRRLSQVCSRWRQVALDVCPIWPHVNLTFDNDGKHEDNLRRANIALKPARGRSVAVPVHRQPGVGDVPYIQTTLSTVAPYIKQLSSMRLHGGGIEQIQPFLDFWLEKGIPGSISDLNLALEQASLFSPGTNSRSSDQLFQFLRHVTDLNLSSVGLNWSSVALDRLTSVWLEDMPDFCCPTLAQLAQILSTCPALENLGLSRINIPASPHSTPPEPAELKHLRHLTLEEVNVSRVLSIISPGRCNLVFFFLGDALDDINTLESLRSFAGGANIRELFLTLSETRSDTALTQILNFAVTSTPDLECRVLLEMNLHDSELLALANPSLTQSSSLPHPTSVFPAGEFPQIDELEFMRCNIHATAEVLHAGISTLCGLRQLTFSSCNHLYTAQDEAGDTTETLKRITATSEFGIRLKELTPSRLDFGE